jgi:hypothetical protein
MRDDLPRLKAGSMLLVAALLPVAQSVAFGLSLWVSSTLGIEGSGVAGGVLVGLGWGIATSFVASFFLARGREFQLGTLVALLTLGQCIWVPLWWLGWLGWLWPFVFAIPCALGTAFGALVGGLATGKARLGGHRP